MESLKAQKIPQWCDEQNISPSHYYNLKRIGRGPVETRLGGAVRITPENSAKWRRDIEANPIVEGVRRSAEKVRAAEAQTA